MNPLLIRWVVESVLFHAGQIRMLRTIGITILLALLGVFSGILLSFISGLPATPEMSQYQQEFNALGDQGISPERFEELKALANASKESMLESNFALKNFVVDFVVLPAFALILAYLWFKAGVYLSGRSPQVAYSIVAICIVVLFLFGYLYQPVIHAIGLMIGVFWNRIKARADFSE